MNWAAHRHMETIERTDIRWHIGLAIGALCVSASAVLLGLADTTPATATVARSALALPVVAALAFFERRHNGGLGSRKYLSAGVCGVLFAGGIFEHAVGGTNPTWGTVHAVAAALCYSGFLFLLRRGGQGGRPLQTYAVVLASSTVVAVAVGSRRAVWTSHPALRRPGG